MGKKIGELLVEANLLAVAQLDEALKIQNQSGGRLGAILIELGFVQERDVAEMLSKKFGVPAINLAGIQVEGRFQKLVPAEVARKYLVMPISSHGATLTLAMADPENAFAMDDIKFTTGYMVEPVVASERTIQKAINQFYGSNPLAETPKKPGKIARENATVTVIAAADENSPGRERASDQAAAAELLNTLLAEAVAVRAASIHFEPGEKNSRIRFRIDGLLHEQTAPPRNLHHAIIAHLKALTNLDVTLRHRPQDGPLLLKITRGGLVQEIDMRISLLPCRYGEKAVLKVQAQDRLPTGLAHMGFEPPALKSFQTALGKAQGMVLLTGPAGSGRSDTLSSAMHRLNKPTANIMTVAIPAGANISGINQIQMSDGRSAVAVEECLRQDPDVIVIGAIDDGETAAAAVKASLSGCLVLANLVGSDAPSALKQMTQMGIEPFLVANSIHCVVAQRRVRRLCNQCRTQIEVARKTLRLVGMTETEAAGAAIFKSSGCAACHHSGTQGHIGLYEVMEVNQPLQQLLLNESDTPALRQLALREGMINLRRSGIQKILAGICSIEEVCKETVL